MNEDVGACAYQIKHKPSAVNRIVHRIEVDNYQNKGVDDWFGEGRDYLRQVEELVLESKVVELGLLQGHSH